MDDQNLFLGLLVPDLLHEIVCKGSRILVRNHGFTGKPVEAKRLHVSLAAFNPFEDGVVQRVSAITNGIRFPPFEIRFETAMSFRNRERHPFVLTGNEGMKGVRAVHAALYECFPENAVKPKSFTPHLTLLRDPKLIEKYSLIRTLSWTVSEFVLVRSLLKKPPEYVFEGRWPLIE